MPRQDRGLTGKPLADYLINRGRKIRQRQPRTELGELRQLEEEVGLLSRTLRAEGSGRLTKQMSTRVFKDGLRRRGGAKG